MTLINQNPLQPTHNFSHSWEDYISQRCTLQSYEAKSHLISTSTQADTLFLIKEGCIKLTSLAHSGHEHLVGIRGENDFIGLELLSEKPYYTLDAIALTDVKAYRISEQHLFELRHLTSDFSIDITKKLNNYTFESWEQINHFHFPLKVRIALMFLRLGERYGKVIDSDNVLLELRLTHNDIGNFVNATRVSVSMNIGELRKEGSLSSVNQSYLLNIPQLRQLVFPY